ncbi:MAG: Lrp/AsnC family transcriptional regulator [Candidatus Omnitrophica bacterium]|nr:Lrp/AsnC family transcriptional regulator [Candidatus Omnitrophota bacterium]
MLAKLDRLILKELQDNFPISRRPFADSCRKFGLSEEELICKVRSLKKRKLIRYLGAIFETKKLGIKSTLVAMNVPRKRLFQTVRMINSYPQVSHNYLRSGKYNIWFTLSAASKAKLALLLKEIKRRANMEDVLNLETVKVFKINARFKLEK